MENHIVKILEAQYINHDVKRFVVEKPTNFNFVPGQSVNLAINIEGWEKKFRPFSITCLNDQDYVEFMIKIHKDHEGVTDMLGRTNAGVELILRDVFGDIEYKGPGVFIAGGSGITPFISIFRDLYKSNKIQGNKLIYSNKTFSDIILEEELEKMLGNNFIKLFTRENVVGFLGKRIDRNFLIENISDFGQNFYLCGPKEFVNSISAYLKDLGANPEAVIFDK